MDWTEFKLSWEMFQAPPTSLAEGQQRQITDIARRQRLIEHAVLSSMEAAGVSIPFATLDARLAEIRARYASPAELREELSRLTMTEADLAEAVSRDLRVEAVLDKVAADMPEATAVDAELYYRLNPAAFTRPEMRQLRHILLTFDTPEEKRRARATLEQLRKEITDAEAFASAALHHSQCPTAMQDGILGMVKAGQLYPELDPVAFSLAAGALSPVLESPVGLHLLRCDQIFPCQTLSFSEVRTRIMTTLTEQRREKARRRWLRSLLTRHKERGAEYTDTHGSIQEMNILDPTASDNCRNPE